MNFIPFSPSSFIFKAIWISYFTFFNVTIQSNSCYLLKHYSQYREPTSTINLYMPNPKLPQAEIFHRLTLRFSNMYKLSFSKVSLYYKLYTLNTCCNILSFASYHSPSYIISIMIQFIYSIFNKKESLL